MGITKAITSIQAIRRVLGALLLAILCLSATDSWARLPPPIVVRGVVLAVDLDTSSLVFKSAKDKRPFVLLWDKDTQFIKDGQPATPAALTNGASVVIHYKDLSFRNPLLRKVISSGSTAGK